MRRSIAVLAAVSVLALLPVAEASAKPAPITGKLSAVAPLGLAGVSPDATLLPDGTVRLYYFSMEGGTAADLCTMAGQCTRQGLLRGISDLTVVTLADGTRRGYFVQMEPATQAKSIVTAVMSPDGLSYTSPTPVGIASAPGQRAWGVPDSVVLPDGRVRLYWVDEQAGSPGESVVSATSTDSSGTTFVRDAGARVTGGVVDFEVLQAKTGTWIAVASTTPGNPPQKLLIASSADGLTWKVNRKSLSPATSNYIDPTGFATGPNTFRLYVTLSPKATPFDGFDINQMTLKVKPPK